MTAPIVKLAVVGLSAAAAAGIRPAPAAQPDQKGAERTWTDPQRAAAEDPDFTVQGEYGAAAAGQPWGVQVVALGGGRFDAYLLEGGLPGLGWDRSRARIRLHGERTGSRVALAAEDGSMTAAIADGRIVVRRGGAVLARLPRIERRSPTLGAEPPAGAIVLFDGTNADEWIHGRVENGLLPNDDLLTRRTFTDFQIHLEFRTPYKPYARGQQRGNSGVYYQGRYETQVLDSFGLEGKINECGAVYSIAPPRINMCLPPLTWQTFDVDFTAARFDDQGRLRRYARITVRHNGVLVHEELELPRTTTAAPIKDITPEPGPIYIQHHGNRVYYRNIWIVPK